MTAELRNEVTSQRDQLVAASDATSTEVALVQRRLEELQLRPLSEPASGNEDADENDRDATATNLEHLLEALKLSQTLLQELLSRSEPAEVERNAQRSDTTTNITFGTNLKGMQVGVSHGQINFSSGR